MPPGLDSLAAMLPTQPSGGRPGPQGSAGVSQKRWKRVRLGHTWCRSHLSPLHKEEQAQPGPGSAISITASLQPLLFGLAGVSR